MHPPSPHLPLRPPQQPPSPLPLRPPRPVAARHTPAAASAGEEGGEEGGWGAAPFGGAGAAMAAAGAAKAQAAAAAVVVRAPRVFLASDPENPWRPRGSSALEPHHREHRGPCCMLCQDLVHLLCCFCGADHPHEMAREVHEVSSTPNPLNGPGCERPSSLPREVELRHV